MKQLLSGTALATLLALSIPAWAQSPVLSQAAPDTHQHAPSMQPQPSAATPRAAPPARTTAEQSGERMPRRQMMRRHEQRHSGGQMHRRGQMHERMHRGGMARSGRDPSDNVANQLNAQEAQRLSGGGMGPGGHGMPMRGGPGQMQMQPPPGSAPPGAPMR